MNDFLSKVKAYFKKVKHIEIIVAILLCIALLGVYLVNNSRANSNENVQDESGYGYCAQMSDNLLGAVRLMTNSEDCKVIINWESGVESVIAYTTTTSGSSTTKTPEIITGNGKSSPIILREEFPRAISVAVVCPSNTSVATKLDIKHMVSTLLEIDVNSVAIYSC